MHQIVIAQTVVSYAKSQLEQKHDSKSLVPAISK